MLKDLSLLLKYLSAIPVPADTETGDREIGRSLRALPLFGLLLGLTVSVVAYYSSFIGFPVAAALALGAEALLTKGIHIQGTMNALSGLNMPKAAAGVRQEGGGAAIVWAFLLLIFKYVLYLMLIQSGRLFWALAAAFVFSRWLLAFIVYALPAATYSGLALVWKRNFQQNDFLFASFTALFIFVVLKSGVFFVAAALTVALIFYFCRRSAAQTGGQNLDSYGAAVEWGEIFFLLAVLFLQSGQAFIQYLCWLY